MFPCKYSTTKLCKSLLYVLSINKHFIHILHGIQLYYNNLRTDLIKILADYEAVIDFSDDDVGDSIFFNNRDKLLKINDKIREIIQRSQNSEKIREGFKISIIGPTNSGKSSLIAFLVSELQKLLRG